jgi:hypothetical protein
MFPISTQGSSSPITSNPFSFKNTLNDKYKKYFQLKDISIYFIFRMKCAVVTIAVGEKYLQEYNSIFRRHTEHYCQKHGYDFILITEYGLPDKYPISEFVNIMKWTLSYREDIQQYDRIAIVDADMIITPNCPPIHELELNDKVGTVDEYSQPTPELRIEIQRSNGWETSAKDYYKIHTMGKDLDTTRVLNGGLCICSPKLHGEFFRTIFKRHVDGTFTANSAFHYEQSHFGYELQTTNMYSLLDNKWNMIVPIMISEVHLKTRDRKDYIMELYKNAYIIHFCGNCYRDIAKELDSILP